MADWHERDAADLLPAEQGTRSDEREHLLTESRVVRTPQVVGGDAIDAVMARPLPETAGDLLTQFTPRSSSVEVVYLSTPITTGPRLLSWLRHHRAESGDRQLETRTEIVRQEVINDNIARLAPLRERVLDRSDGTHLIDPTTLEVPGWKQWEYHRFWAEVLLAHVDRIVFADGWELSTGCTIEYAIGLAHEIPMADSQGRTIDPSTAHKMLSAAADELEGAGRDSRVALAAAERARGLVGVDLKDTQLANLADTFNVASFVSFTPHVPRVRWQVYPGPLLPRHSPLDEVIAHLLAVSPSRSLNVRTFQRSYRKGNPFYYGLTSVEQVVQRVQEAAAAGYYSIVNETIDVHDGGVSGVSLGGITEFAPDDTPRAVEKPNIAKLPVDVAERILRIVYGTPVYVPTAPSTRIEFSLHPRRVGHRREQTIVWETESVSEVELKAVVDWPNRFSSLLGDKVFGLLMAHACGASVPRSYAIPRRVAPFLFGASTGTNEWWMRTAPGQQDPGHFSTTRGWTDPFSLLQREDPDALVASVLSQESVEAHYSGASMPVEDERRHIIEGVRGYGDDFMLGEQEPVSLPDHVQVAVTEVISLLEAALGPVRIEWAFDGDRAWVLQLHMMRSALGPGVISPGDAVDWIPFDPAEGLGALHNRIEEAVTSGAGIEVSRAIGVTSHVGDILRKAGVPARFNVLANTV